MRVLLTSISRYPARGGGLGSSRVHDVLAKGLGELGHTVYYSVAEGYGAALPEGVVASGREVDADLYHFIDYPTGGEPPPAGKPWVRTFHAPVDTAGDKKTSVDGHFIFVSRAHARSFGATRYVWNGIDPEECVYSETKDDFFLFVVSALSRAESKGLLTAIAVVERLGARLLVAAEVDVEPVRSPHVTYLGAVEGERKAILFARARALLFPVRVCEPFGLVVAEALMSGTPVLGSRWGALPELVTSDVGFLCDSVEEYVVAAERLRGIRAEDCRRRSMTEFHYRVMTARYVAEYEREMG
jgi:glycosyltransferase involved in cell wall biosynthesis